MSDRLRIAQVAPPIERVPPEGYGGTERVVFELIRELVARGHDVTTFASGDSEVPGTSESPDANVVTSWPRATSSLMSSNTTRSVPP